MGSLLLPQGELYGQRANAYCGVRAGAIVHADAVNSTVCRVYSIPQIRAHIVLYGTHVAFPCSQGACLQDPLTTDHCFSRFSMPHKAYLNLIGGEHRPARSGKTFLNVNPADHSDV